MLYVAKLQLLFSTVNFTFSNQNPNVPMQNIWIRQIQLSKQNPQFLYRIELSPITICHSAKKIVQIPFFMVGVGVGNESVTLALFLLCHLENLWVGDHISLPLDTQCNWRVGAAVQRVSARRYRESSRSRTPSPCICPSSNHSLMYPISTIATTTTHLWYPYIRGWNDVCRCASTLRRVSVLALDLWEVAVRVSIIAGYVTSSPTLHIYRAQ
jgi:hypothetical protein